MPRLTKIYTRKGDDGSTALGTRQRVNKNSLRVSSYGEVDELNASIGLSLAFDMQANVQKSLKRIQNELLVLGAELAFPPDEKRLEIPLIKNRHILDIERDIDRLNEKLGPLENFILPGGSLGAASLQLARTICRRAERSLVSLNEQEPLRKESLAYINRLSDLLFVMGRFENESAGGSEEIWNSRI